MTSSAQQPEDRIDGSDLNGSDLDADEELGDDGELDDDLEDDDDEDVDDDDDDDDEEVDDEEVDDLDDDDLDDDDDDDDDNVEDFDDEDGQDDVDDEYEPGDVNAVETAPYEAGDVNTISAPAGRAAEPAAAPRGEMPIAVLEYLARSMADEPDAVVIRREDRRGSTILRLHVAPRDMGRVIGRRGRTAQAIRTLVGVAGVRGGVQTVVDIADD